MKFILDGNKGSAKGSSEPTKRPAIMSTPSGVESLKVALASNEASISSLECSHSMIFSESLQLQELWCLQQGLHDYATTIIWTENRLHPENAIGAQSSFWSGRQGHGRLAAMPVPVCLLADLCLKHHFKTWSVLMIITSKRLLRKELRPS